MSNELSEFDNTVYTVATLYILIGVFGFILNMATLLMIIIYRAYRLSAYTIMANLALADAVMLIVAGIICGFSILHSPFPGNRAASSSMITITATAAASLPSSSSSLLLSPLLHSSRSSASSSSSSSSPTPMSRLPTLTSSTSISSLSSSIPLSLLSSLSPTSTPSVFSFDQKQRESLTNDRKQPSHQLTFPSPPTVYHNLGRERHDGAQPSSDMSPGQPRINGSYHSIHLISFIEISAWTAGMITYALLGINRCVAICFYRTRAKNLNRVSLALAGATVTWLIGIITGLCIAAFHFGKHGCYIHASLTFQFFYPSLICTISSVIFFAKPFMVNVLTNWQFVFLHLIWLCNHACNPFIYAYFNERMRISYRRLLTCAPAREYLHTWRGKYLLKHGSRLHASRRMNVDGPPARTAPSRNRHLGSADFVRTSLQMQSRDFEQLCEFMMRVNPANDSSEGWTEGSSCDLERMNAACFQASTLTNHRREPQSLVYDLGRHAVEHWVTFAKKASL